MSMIIVGGGITGLTLALIISRLTDNQFPIDLIERFPLQDIKNHPSFDDRAIALSQGTCQHLSRIGIWKLISDCATPIKKIHVNDHGHAGFFTIDAKNYHINELGQVVQLREVGLRLFKLLSKATGVTLHCPSLATNIIRSESTVSVILDDGKVLKAEILIAADGSCSKLAFQCGISYKQYPYNQVAVVANISTTLSHEWRAWECFTEYGPIAILPISKKQCSLVWCHPLDKKNEVLSWSNERFCTELQKVFGWRLGRIIHAEKRTSYLLMLTTSTRSVAHRVVLVGNAAQTLHPIAGQGFNLGLRDVLNLGEILVQAWSKKQDCGDYSILNYYQQCRQLDKEKTIKITDFLVTLFSNHWIPLVLGRNISLMAMELFIPLRAMLEHRVLNWITR